MTQLKIGIVGAGSFAHSFIPLFQAHPSVGSVALAELLPERRQEVADKFGIQDLYDSHASLCESNVDAVAIFTQRHLHGPQAVHALNCGKHVYCAVPAAQSMKQIESLIHTVKQTGLIYMSGETSYYYPSALYCREKYANGEFGHFVYGEGEYLHDMAHGFYEAFQHSGGKDWKQVAGIPPMLYPTHSTSMLISVTGARLTQVSCLGYKDRHADQIYGTANNHWNNPFSNQSALFRTSDGGIFRVNEMRRIGHGVGNCVRTSLYGTEGCFEEQGNAILWTTLDRQREDLWDALSCHPENPEDEKFKVLGAQEDFYSGTSSIHPIHRLPESFIGQPNGHYGSHQFLVDDFIRSLTQNKLAPNHVWAAARYLIPGLMAHESSLQEGQLIQIPDYGEPDAHWEYISYD